MPGAACVLALQCVALAAATDTNRLTPAQLLAEFSKTQDRIQSCSYLVMTEDIMAGGPESSRKLFYHADVRWDSVRAELRQQRWGDMTVPAGAVRAGAPHAPFSREKAEYRHELWTATNHFAYRFWDTPYWRTYRNGDPRRGTLRITPARSSALEPKRQLMAGQFGAAGYLFGYLRGDHDRCDVILKSAAEVRLRQQRERINGVDCWVLEARRAHGKWNKRYTLWFSPGHGYNLARIHTRTEAENGPGGPWGESDLRHIQFRQIDGIWVPTQAEESYVQCPDPAASPTTGRLRIRITAMHVNPDHEALKSFHLEDVREGAAVTLSGDGRMAVRGAWQGVRVIGPDGAVLWTAPNRTARAAPKAH